MAAVLAALREFLVGAVGVAQAQLMTVPRDHLRFLLTVHLPAAVQRAVTVAEVKAVVVLAPEVLLLRVVAPEMLPVLGVEAVPLVLMALLAQALVAVVAEVMREVREVVAALAALVIPVVQAVRLAQQLLTALALPPEGRIRLQ